MTLRTLDDVFAEAAELPAARARIAELESKQIDSTRFALKSGIELAKRDKRISELEDWQRRAVSWMRDDSVDCNCPVIGGCAWCRTRNDLVEEATR